MAGEQDNSGRFQHQQRLPRQALQEIRENGDIENTSLRQHLPCIPRPETPTSHSAESARTELRIRQRAARSQELEISPRRRRAYRIHDENLPPPAESSGHNNSLPQSARSRAQQARRARERQQRLLEAHRLQSAALPLPPPAAPDLLLSPPSTTPRTHAACEGQRSQGRDRLQHQARELGHVQQAENSVPTSSGPPIHSNNPQHLPTPPSTQHDASYQGNAVQEPIVVRQPNTFVGDGDQQMQNGVNAFDNGSAYREAPAGRDDRTIERSNHVDDREQGSRRARTSQQQGLWLAGRRPYCDPPQRHDLGRMDALCSSCAALHWMDERLSDSSKTHPRFGTCCMNGKVQLPPLEAPPEPLLRLLTSSDPDAVKFRDESWKYNRAFAFTSLGVQEDHSVNQGHHRGPPVFRICGELRHWSGALLPDELQHSRPRYAQLYIYEPRAALEARAENNQELNQHILQSLQAMFLEHHQYVPLYRHAYEVLQQYGPQNDAQIRLRLSPGLDRRRYNLPTADEVAVILPGNPSTEPRDIVLRLRSGPLQRVSDLHPAYAPLQYPLLFPRGENGWYPEMRLLETEDQQNHRLQQCARRHDERRHHGIELGNTRPSTESRRLTLSRYVAHRIHYRPDEFNPLLCGGRLFTRYIVDMFASVDQQRLSWILRNQPTFRAARFNNLEDAAATDDDNLDLNDLGQRVFLPSSYTGGPRNMSQGFQDSMAIARYYRKVDIFLTVTTNPHWVEIERELLLGQTAYDRPDLVARVFQLKRKAIIDYIYKEGIFGHAVAYVYTIEFQKRGLPHMHCLIFLKEPYKLLTPEDIDSCISAEWPDPETQPLLFETVKTCMVHGPCGAANPNAPCMVDGKCSKNYPKDWQEFTTMDRSGYPLYHRRDDGRAYEVGGKMIDNRSIVPYPPFLCGVFHCHINMECAISLGTFKYAFKYIQKGPDRASFELNLKDEVKRFIDGRYISAPDAVWRILHYDIHEQIPNVVRLQVHLPNHHMVIFNPNDDLDIVLQRGALQRTTLTAFFEANSDTGAFGEEARKYTYQEFPQHFVFDANTKKWKIRKRGFALGRMYFIKPTAGEQFYLRTLLTVVKGAKSFEDLRRVPGINQPLPTYYAACLARGLLEDDGEWRLCLQEACEMQTGTRLRHLFATLLLFAEPAQPDVLWMEFCHHICDDLEQCLRAMGIHNPPEWDVYDYGLYLLDRILSESGHSLADFPSMPQHTQDWATLTENSLIAEQLNYNRDEQRADLNYRLPNLNNDQKLAYTRITNTMQNNEGNVFFLNGSGGTGKTYVYNTVCAKLRSEGTIVLCVSSSGISALLIRGGRTAHSMFKIPIDTLAEGSFCNIAKNSQRAELLCAAKALIWDEVGAQHRHAIEAVDRTLRDVRNDDHPFGGITVVLGGDFLQTLPVVPRGSREDIVDATIQHSHLWEKVEVLHLQQNMRLEQSTDDARQFAQWLLDVGHGTNMTDGSHVQLPENMRVQDSDSLINAIYPAIDTVPPPPPEYFKNRMILAPRNADVAELNQQILDRMSGQMRQYISADKMIRESGADPDDGDNIPVEFLRSVNSSSLPPGELNLKVGCPIILLRNLSPSMGLCNGSRLVVTQMGDRVIEARIIGGEHNGEIAMIPRISLTPSSKAADVTFRFRRRQFPVRLAFALSINKSQGQSVKYIGLDLRIPVFAHGQLYVALSRATSSHNIKVLLPQNELECRAANVVYKEVLID